LTYKEIAKVLHISMPNVKLRLLRAKKKLKSILEGNL
ncbi:RNA polymerase sigma factor, partial [Butyricicoccus sp. 1XD8-22]